MRHTGQRPCSVGIGSVCSLLAAWSTYEVRVGGLGQLLLGILTGGGIFLAVSRMLQALQSYRVWGRALTRRQCPLQHLVDIHDCRRVLQRVKEGYRAAR